MNEHDSTDGFVYINMSLNIAKFMNMYSPRVKIKHTKMKT